MKRINQILRAPALFVLILCAVVVGGSVLRKNSGSTPSSQRYMDMRSWRYTPGVLGVTNSEVALRPLDQRIVDQDGSGGQPNPAVNVVGDQLEFSKDFTLAMPFSCQNSCVLDLRLYTTPPVIYDEWRLEPVSLGVAIRGATTQIRIWDGTSEDPWQTLQLNASDQMSITISRHGNRVRIGRGKATAQISAGKLFDSGRWWLGATTQTSGIKLNKFSVTSHADHPASFNQLPSVARSPGDTLRSATTNRFRIGAAVGAGPLFADPYYRNLALQQFSSWTIENDLKAQFVQPTAGDFEFGPTDALLQLAHTNDIVVHGHALVFGEANPGWMQQASKQEQKKIMLDHVQVVVGHYRDRIGSWDVVNEPLSDSDADYKTDGLRRHIWYRAMGASYIADAFRAARSADPRAQLYLNDYGLEADGERWDALVVLLSKLKSQNVPIDGVGFQSHVYAEEDEIDKSTLIRHMKQLAEMGLAARISEIDVHGEDLESQAEQYAVALSACLAAPNCSGYTTWGITDKYGSTTADHTYPAEFGNDLLWNDIYAPKPAHDRLVQVLRQTKK